jgi:hypothetical protein
MADYKLNKQIRAQCNAFRQVSKPQSLDAGCHVLMVQSLLQTFLFAEFDYFLFLYEHWKGCINQVHIVVCRPVTG